MDFQALIVEERREVLRVVLNRPERQNSINDVLLAELHAVLDLAERSPHLRIVTLAATGPVFCSGMDFESASRNGHNRDDIAARGGEAFFDLLHRITTVPRLVVSLVDGRVTGGGVGLVAAGDLVYATPASTFGLPEALWGLLPCCVLPFLIRRTGFQPAYAMTLSTLPVPAEQAERFHLVDEVADDPAPALRRLASRLTKFDESTVGAAKRYFGDLCFPAEQQRRVAVAEFSRLMSSPAVQHRIAAFASHQRLPWEAR
ncbi:enoyl-CoA hydratase-related protein [Dactylosporangium matsuzakiense]|uniref:Enoyl-CoA hydratase n=1 Tax=Dactylosporangium matsuzakiense TaxID=53360 RepID=A0A9W6KNI4_9ACTN|nr:enoyl-CoA hydratase-related protein [Dactylosporangium matsuzakiense]UWZ42315.1 enoyl-CoA hydratase/isomerase family protein [Dactylosporangium matsuzakiense]GLL05311.1 enoyl-CoA hydratase [Dactylosporangium matsuzakiense]